MATLSRRTFLGASALSLAAVRLHADPLGIPIGCQTYPVRDALGKDIPGTLKQLAGVGTARSRRNRSGRTTSVPPGRKRRSRASSRSRDSS